MDTTEVSLRNEDSTFPILVTAEEINKLCGPIQMSVCLFPFSFFHLRIQPREVSVLWLDLECPSERLRYSELGLSEGDRVMSALHLPADSSELSGQTCCLEVGHGAR